MSGNTIGSLVGGGLGMAFGPLGAQIGFALGGVIGGYLAPTKITGPRLTDASQQTSQEGVPITFGYGTFPCTGNVVWQGPVVEHEHEDDGKGSGTTQVPYTYTRSYAIGICEGPITGIQQVRRNGKLVYDISPGSTILGQNAKFLAKATFYLGDETQLVDPTIEAIEGVGNTGPMRGLAYMVVEDDETNAGEIAQYEFVVQMCGVVSAINDDRVRFIGSGATGFAETSTTGATWPNQSTGLSGVTLRFLAVNDDIVVASSNSGQMYRSLDRGQTWAPSTTVTSYDVTDVEYGNHLFVGVTSAGTVVVSSDDGDTWSESTPPHTIVGISKLAFGGGIFVMTAGTSGLSGGGVYTSANGTDWTLVLAQNMSCACWNGQNFMVAGSSGACYTSPTGTTWTYGSSPGGVQWSFTTVTGGPGFFLAGTNSGTGSIGIYKSTDLGVTWTYKGAFGSHVASAGGDGYFAFVTSVGVQYTQDSGETWTAATGTSVVVDVVYAGPSPDWYAVPDAEGVYANEDGELVTSYVTGSSISSCGAYLDDIVADLCDRSGVDASEYDFTALSGIFVAGYKCATETTASAFIEPLTAGFFFDLAEWDKKLRAVLRGGAVSFALTPDDLVAMDGPAIEQTRIQEVELLRKVNVMAIDPEAGYKQTKQSAERRAGTVIALAENTIEIPVVTDKDTQAQMAEKRLKVAHAETDKFKLALSNKWSKLTPTDVGTLTDKRDKVHRIRLSDLRSENGVNTIEEASKDRAATYTSSALGSGSNGGLVAPALIGPTLFAAMNLPQLRSADNTPGLYVGACGILGGWRGCYIMLSVDGGVSYSIVKTITTPTKLGTLTAAITDSGSPLSVHIFGGQLESKSLVQVALGANWSAVESGGVAEVLAYRTATEGAANYYDLTDLTRDMQDTTAAAHAIGDQFMDLSTAYFLRIDQSLAGETLYFKAVAFGLTADQVTAVPVVFEGATYFHDGGEVVP